MSDWSLPDIDDQGWEAFNRDLLKAETDTRIRDLSRPQPQPAPTPTPVLGGLGDFGSWATGRIQDLGNLVGGAASQAGAFAQDVGQGFQEGFQVATAPPAPSAPPEALPAPAPATLPPTGGLPPTTPTAVPDTSVPGALSLPSPEVYPESVWSPMERRSGPFEAAGAALAPLGQAAGAVGEANTAAQRFYAGDFSAIGDVAGALVSPLAPVAETLRKAQTATEATNRAQLEQLQHVTQTGRTPEEMEQLYQAGTSFAGAGPMASTAGQAASRVAGARMPGGLARLPGAQQAYSELADRGANADQLAGFAAKVEELPVPPGVTAGEWFKALRYNSMLSGPRTFMVNTISNALEVPWRLARDIPASVARGRPEELLPEVAGIWTGMKRGADAFMETVSKGISEQAAQRGDLPQDIASRLDPSQAARFPGVVQAAQPVARGLEFTGRLLRGADDFAQQTAYGMAMGRRAALGASKEGLRGEAWTNRVAELLETPTTGMQKEALDTSRRMTYQQDLSGFGSALQELQRKGGVAGHIVLPFLRTVYNITEAGIRRSPAGLVHTAYDVARGNLPRQAAAGAMPLGERVGDNVIGSLASLWFLNQALQGNISGGGPSNARQREVLQSEGWQPYAVRVGDQWIGYGNWGPMAIPLSMAAAVGEGVRYREPGADVPSQVGDVLGNFTGLLTEQPYLQGIGGIYKAMTDPERYGSQWLNSFVGSLVPYGAAIGTVAQVIDPLERQPARASQVGIPEAVLQGVQKRIPVAREQLPVARDVFGRERPNVYAGASAAIPLRSTGATGPAIRRYLGSQSAADDTRIGQAVAEVDRWRARPTEYPRPSTEAIRLHARFKGAENPRYQTLIQRETARERRAAVSTRP